MQYEVNFGQLTRPTKVTTGTARFRLAVLGDFSGRANAGKLEIGEALARRKPIAVDVDNLDDVLARMSLKLSLALGNADDVVEVPIGSLDDFHPDQLVENVELFGTLLQLRRDLASRTGFARASKEVLSWSGEEKLPAPANQARGAIIATDLRLSDFARLTGRPNTQAGDGTIDDLVRRLVGPFVRPDRDVRQEQLTARVDEALSAAMRRVLHHPDFQAAEAMWRGVELLVRRIETGARLQIVLYDVSAEELAADLASVEALEDSGLYGMLVEQPAQDADQGPLSVVVGMYGFELSPPHADLLGRVAQVAAASGAPFVTGIDPDALQTPMYQQHIMIREAWTALWELPASGYLGLAAVKFLLRMPYGKKSDPIDAFAFEEFTREAGLSGMLWANPALAVGLLLAQGWQKAGAKMKPGAISIIGDMPYYVYNSPDGDQVALPCTERLYSERQASQAVGYHVMPILSLRGRPEVRLAGITSVAGSLLAGFWGSVFAEAALVPVSPSPEPIEDASDESDEIAATPDEETTSEGEAEPEAEATPDDSSDDLDALLAGLSAPTAEVADGEAEADLDALLASL